MLWTGVGLVGAVGTIGSAINANQCQPLSAVVHQPHSVAHCWHCWHTSCQQGATLRGDLQPANQTNMGNILQQYLVLVLLFVLMASITDGALSLTLFVTLAFIFSHITSSSWSWTLGMLRAWVAAFLHMSE